ncbi:MAG: DUF1338 domain-containing protein [Rickettsiales bacterium]|nr:DUF1338 domain-containing protein [Rickettsiales bacterium]
MTHESQEALATALLDRLWAEYIERVEYAKQYVDLVNANGGTVLNDHIALRTFNTDTGGQPAGAAGLSRIIEPLGYTRKTQYDFPSKHLTAWHWEHRNPRLPKIFISQLEVEALAVGAEEAVINSVKDTPDPLSAEAAEYLKRVAHDETLEKDDLEEAAELLASVFTRPWDAPKKSLIEPLNDVSQYAAWTLLHGNSVNHFTAFINHQNVDAWPDIEATVAALLDAGVPMKDHIEGEPGSKLRQSSTKAVDCFCDVMNDKGKIMQMNWTYAYYEFAERGTVEDEDGNKIEFTGFLGEQATNLFEMTRKHG